MGAKSVKNPLKEKKTTIITSVIALFTAASVTTAGSLEAPDIRMPGEELSPKSAYIDRAELDDEIPDEDGDENEEEEDEERRKNGARRRSVNMPLLKRLLAALAGGLGAAKLLRKRSVLLLLMAAAILTATDSVLGIVFPAYRAVRPFVLTLAVSLAVLGVVCTLLIMQKRREAALAASEEAPEPEPEPEPEPPDSKITLVDCGGEFTIDPENLHGE